MILSDRDILAEIDGGRIVVKPFEPERVQPSSIDVRIDNQFRVFQNHRYKIIDVKQRMDDLTELVEVAEEEPFILHPGEFVLGSTREWVELPADIAGRLEGKSSLGRLGLVTHSTAGFIDPSFTGHLTLELSNLATLPITLYPGMLIGQIAFFRLSGPADTGYGTKGLRSKYQGQAGPTPSRYWENFVED
ncbi:MAG: dCTP deaminase [Actinomycetota bacterium]|nr:dCTP deaminase [Actinomycetota bacterium]